MTTHTVIPAAEIDAQLERALDRSDGPLTAAREAVMETGDRWYGQLVAGARDAAADTASAPVVPAAGAAELVRGYARLRTASLGTHSADPDPSAALLAGDYLYTAAYSSLSAVPNPALDGCFGALTDGLTSVTVTFARAHESDDGAAAFDRVAGVVGETAARLGASLGDADDTQRERLAAFGRAAAAERAVRRVLRRDSSAIANADEPALRERQAEKREEAERTLETLRTDATGLRELVDCDQTPVE